MGSNIQIPEISRRGDNIHRRGLGRLQRNSKIIKRRLGNAWRSCPETYTRKQKIIARCRATARSGMRASGSKGIVSLSRDLIYEMKPVLAIDAKATEHIFHRRGIGKLSHFDVAYLWLRDEIRSKSLRVRRVQSEENVVGLGTRPLSRAVISKHFLTLGYVNMAEDSVPCERQVVAMFWDFGSADSSQQQAVADHVQTAASSNGSNRSSGSKRGGQRRVYGRPREVLGRLLEMSQKLFIHCSRLRHRAHIDLGKFRQGEYPRIPRRIHHHCRR